MTNCAPSLPCCTATFHGDRNIELVSQLHQFQRLTHDHARRLATEKAIQRSIVHGDLTAAGLHKNARS